jgi:two-component system, sensor histidine kinase
MTGAAPQCAPPAVSAPAGLCDQIPCGLVRLDRAHAIMEANLYSQRMLGYTRDDLTRLRFHELLTAAGRIFVQSRLWPELALAGRAEEVALDLIGAGGKRIPVLLNLMQARDAAGQPAEIQIAFTRAVAKRAYEAEVPRARQAAAEAAQVKADFLANISHELRTPLNAIVGGADALGRTALSAEQAEIVDLVQSSGTSLQRIISDILELSRIEAGQLEIDLKAFDLTAALGGVIDRTRLQAQDKGLEFALETGPGAHGQFLGDPVRIMQILGHLASNAVKFTPGGSIRVTVDIEDRAEAEDAVLHLDVEDTGIGFDDATGDALFSRFRQAEKGLSRTRGGVGIGLTLCKALSDLMGGAITARSRPGRGSRFSVRLPLRRLAVGSAPSNAPEKERQPEAPDPVPLRVLVVEDQPANRRIVELLLARQKADCVMAANGLLGLQAWQSGDFDVVLMDLQMPVMDGLTAIRSIRAAERDRLLRRTPIAVLSANAMAHHRREALEAGADVHIAKPVTGALLMDGIRSAIARSQAHQSPGEPRDLSETRAVG